MKNKRDYIILHPNSLILPRRDIYTVVKNAFAISIHETGETAENIARKYAVENLKKNGYGENEIQEIKLRESKKNLSKIFVILKSEESTKKIMGNHRRVFLGKRISIQEAILPPIKKNPKSHESGNPARPSPVSSRFSQISFNESHPEVPENPYSPRSQPAAYAESYTDSQNAYPVVYPESHPDVNQHGYPAMYPYQSPGPDSGVQSTESSEASPQTNAEIAQSMGLMPIDMSYAFQQSCVLCAHGIPHPTAEDIPQLMDGTWYNGVKSEHFNTILSFLQP